MTNRLHYLVVISLVATALTKTTLSFFHILPALMISLLVLYYLRHLTIMDVLLVFLVFTVIFFRFIQYELLIETNVTSKQQETIIGEVTQVKNADLTYQRFVIKEKNQASHILVSHFDQLDFQLVPGHLVKMTVTYEAPTQPMNPGQFNYDHYLLSENITKKAIAETVSYEGERFFTPVYSYRQKFLSHLRENLSETSNSMVSALALGEKSLLDDSFKALFSRWHLSHLLAISGLHIGLMVHLLKWFLAKICRLNKESIWLILIVVCVCFPFLSGGSPSVFRASLVGVFGYLALVIKTNVSTMDTLSFVFLIFIIIWPHWLYQLGFQYSFLVTFSLVLSQPILARFKHLFYSMLFITMLSFFITLPLQLSRFYSVNFLSLLINPLVSLLFSFVVIPLCFILVIVALFIPVVLPLGSGLLDVIINSFHIALKAIDETYYFPFVTGKPMFFHLMIYSLCLFLLLKSIDQHKKTKAWLYASLLIISLTIIKWTPILSPYGQVTQLSIGQANILVIEQPHRQGVYLYDVGATTGKDHMTITDEVYTRMIKPFLHYRGIHRINGVFLSHSHQDHIGSLPFLTKDFDVDQIFVNPHFDQSSMLDGEKYTVLETGRQYEMAGFTIEVVLPMGSHADENSQSMVIYARFGPLSFLLTGDIPSEREKEFIALYPNKKVDVLMVPHHGSQTSSTLSFLEHLEPLYGVISVGENNMFNHPHPKVLNDLKEQQIEIFRTDLDGAIMYRFHKRHDDYTWSNMLSD